MMIVLSYDVDTLMQQEPNGFAKLRRFVKQKAAGYKILSLSYWLTRHS